MSGLFVRLKPRAGAALRLTVDGAPVEAREGDTLLTAILLARPALRRFEFGPGLRAGFCLMGACQDCWVTLADGTRARACTTPAADGMSIVTGLATEGPVVATGPADASPARGGGGETCG